MQKWISRKVNILLNSIMATKLWEEKPFVQQTITKAYLKKKQVRAEYIGLECTDHNRIRKPYWSNRAILHTNKKSTYKTICIFLRNICLYISIYFFFMFFKWQHKFKINISFHNILPLLKSTKINIKTLACFWLLFNIVVSRQ